MCYNVAYIEQNTAILEERYAGIFSTEWNKKSVSALLPIYFFASGFSHPLLPIIKHDGIFLYEWGLVPAWVKDEKTAKEIQVKTLNAVGETAFEKASFKKSILSKRCLLPVHGFYEWREYKKMKYPYFIKPTEHTFFSLGCLYENYVDFRTGELKNTFSIITTVANPLMEKIHNLKKRMPLIINAEDEKRWVNPHLTVDEIKNLIQPYDEHKMSAYTISKNASSVRLDRNVPEIMKPIEYNELLEFI